MKKNVRWSVLLFFALIPMLYHADYVTEGAKYGLLLWYQSVVPALFPFMVISSLIGGSGGIPILMAPVYRLLHAVFPISRDGFYILTAGLLCGYPMGAKTCADFLKEGRVTQLEGQFLMAVCNHPSPMFLLGYVYPFFAEWLDAKLLLIAVYAPIVMLAFLARAVYFKNNKYDKNHDLIHTPFVPVVNIQAHLSTDETILSAVTVLCKIGGYLMLFSILIVFLRNMTWIPVYLRLILIGMLEMTTGIRELCASLPPVPSFAASVAALTFGGCSGIFQTKAVLGNEKKAGLSIRPYIVWKLLHSVLSAGIAFLLCNC